MDYNYQKMFWAKYHECERLKKLLEEYGYEPDKVKQPIILKKHSIKPEEIRPSSPHKNSWSRGTIINKQNQSERTNRCKAMKSNDKQCRQINNSNQRGGEIIDGYCEYHKHLRKIT